MCKISLLNKLNSSIRVRKENMYWGQWFRKEICSLNDLYKDGVLLGYNDLLEKY